MDITDLAARLFGSSRAESNSKPNPTTTSTIYGVAHGSSSNGQVPVYISDNITLPEGSSGGPYVTLPTSPHVDDGDVVAITLIGAGSVKHPYISSVIGSGDKLREYSEKVADDISKNLDTDKIIEDFKKTADAEYVQKTYTDPKTGEKVDTLSEYLKSDDAKTAYVSSSQYKTDSESFKQSVSDAYTNATSYTDGKISNEVIARNSAIDQRANSILLSVFSYHGTGVPTVSTTPASGWTDSEKASHEGDIYTDNATGTLYVWNGSDWAEATSDDISAAEANAAKSSVEILADAITSIVSGRATYTDANGDTVDNILQTEIQQNLDRITSTVTSMTSMANSITKLEQTSNSLQASIDTVDTNSVKNDDDFITNAKSTLTFENDSNGTPTLSIETSASEFKGTFSNEALSFYQGPNLLAQINGVSSTMAVANFQIGNYIWKPSPDKTGLRLMYIGD